MIFSRSQKAYDAWLRDIAPRQRGLTGMALERAIAHLAATSPELVTIVN